MEKGFSRNTSRSEREVKIMQTQTQKNILQSALQIFQQNGITIAVGNTLEELLLFANEILYNPSFWASVPGHLQGLANYPISKHTLQREIEIAVNRIDVDD